MSVSIFNDWLSTYANILKLRYTSLLKGQYGAWFSNFFGSAAELYKALDGYDHSREYQKLSADKSQYANYFQASSEKLKSEFLAAFERDLRMTAQNRLGFYRAHLNNRELIRKNISEIQDKVLSLSSYQAKIEAQPT